MLFDAVGTLIELAEPVGECYARAARAHGVELPAWRLEDAFRRVLAVASPMVFPGAAPERVAQREREWWRALVRATFRAADSTARPRDFDALFETLFRHYGDAIAWRCRSGAREALAALRARGIRCGIASNFDQRLRALLAPLGLASGIDAVVLPADAGAAKPDPRLFELALLRLGVRADAALYVGDREVEDLEGARAVGMRTLNVTALASLDALPARVDALAQGVR